MPTTPATLYDFYSQQGKALPTTATARFADPAFAAAAKAAGYDSGSYAVNAGNASANNAILAKLLKASSATPAAPATPVGVLSSTNGAATVQKGLGTLNQVSPTTAPGYTPPPAPPATTASTPTVPKAYFANSAGQEAEFTQAQLTDPANQKFLQDNGYIQTRTEGPNYDTTGTLRQDLSNANTQLKDLSQQFAGYNVDADPAFQSAVASINKNYEALNAAAQKANSQRASALQTLGLRGGTTQYAGGIQMGIEGEELNQANARIAALQNARDAAVSAARLAYQTGKFEEFTKKINAISQIRDDMNAELTTYNTTLAAATKKFQDTAGKASRDSAIANLLAQGVTDPKDILDSLNFDQAGNRVGTFTADEVANTIKNLAYDSKGIPAVRSSRDAAVANLVNQGITDPSKILESLNYDKNGKKIWDFTAEEVSKTLKSLKDDTKAVGDKLTGDLGEYFKLKEAGIPLPPSIAALPPEQQPFAYVRYKGDLERKATQAAAYKDFTFSNEQKGKLIGSGLSSSMIEHLQNGINEYGVEEVLKRETGLTDVQRQALSTSIVGESANKFLNSDYFKKLLTPEQLSTAASAAGFTKGGILGIGAGGDTDAYLKSIDTTIESYRSAGYTDKEILKMMQ